MRSGGEVEHSSRHSARSKAKPAFETGGSWKSSFNKTGYYDSVLRKLAGNSRNSKTTSRKGRLVRLTHRATRFSRRQIPPNPRRAAAGRSLRRIPAAAPRRGAGSCACFRVSGFGVRVSGKSPRTIPAAALRTADCSEACSRGWVPGLLSRV